MRILFICLGNICRSPLAQGILQSKVHARGLDWQVDSAGTSHWHVGEQPDSRTMRVARKHGLDISHQRARQFSQADFETYDVLFTADRSVHEYVLQRARSEAHRRKVQPMADFLSGKGLDEIPDPWYGEEEAFEEVYHLLEELCEAIVNKTG
jgi:protein-tyrosine phosphatase